MELTDIEKTIVRCLAQGMQSKEIAGVIRRRKPTVEGYIRILYAKLDAKSRAHVVAEAIRQGALTLDWESVEQTA
jgi:DNA-binding CsgD family transcriptional regulator